MFEKALKYRVHTGFILVVLGLIFLRPYNAAWVVMGLSAAFLGLLIRSWAAGCIKKSQSLATEGPYAMVRHPLYLGSLLMAMGLMAAVTRPDKIWVSVISWTIFVLYFGIVYSGTIAKEERFLAGKFTDQWRQNAKRVPALIPYRFPNWKKLAAAAFSWAQYRKNKEYQAVLGWTTAAFLFFWALPQEKSAPIVLTPAPIQAPLRVEKNSKAAIRKVQASQPVVSSVPVSLEAPAEMKIELKRRDPEMSLLTMSWLGPSLAGVAALGLADHGLRSDVKHNINDSLGKALDLKNFGSRGSLWDNMGRLSTGLGISGGLYLAGSLSGSQKTQRVGILGAQALFLSGLTTAGLSRTVGRKDPSHNDADSFSLNTKGSFPSSHATSAFALAGVVASQSQSFWVDALAYGLAGTVGMGRVYQDKQWASDVAAGAVIGILSGKMVSHWDSNRRFYASPAGAGVQQKF